MATTNIVNQTTGATGYQVPGAAPPEGWVSTASAPTAGPVSTTVPATGLQTPQAPLSIPPTPTTSVANSINAQAGSLGELIQKQQDATDSAKTDAQNSSGGIMDTLQQYLGVQSSRGQAEQSAGIPALIETQRKAGNDLIVSQRAQQNEIQQLEKNAGGMSASALQGEVQRINRQYANEQADLSLTYHLANSDYTAAQATVDKKIELQLEPLKTKLDYLKYFDQQAQDNWSKQEQRQFDLQKAKVQTELDTKQQNLKDIYNIQIEASKNGVQIPADVMNQINSGDITGSQALGILASKGIVLQDQLDRAYKAAQIESLNANSAKIRIENSQNGTPTIVGADPKISKAISVVLGSGKFTALQKRDFTNSVNSGDDPFTVLKNQAKNLMSGTSQTKLEANEDASSAMNSLDSALKAFYAAGGKTSLIKGSWENAVNKLGEVNDPNLVGLATEVTVAIQKYRNAISGTAYSVQEGQQIDKVFPGITKGQVLNNAIVSARQRVFQSTIDDAYTNTLGSVYGDFKGAQGTQAADVTKSAPTIFDNLFNIYGGK